MKVIKEVLVLVSHWELLMAKWAKSFGYIPKCSGPYSQARINYTWLQIIDNFEAQVELEGQVDQETSLGLLRK